MIRISLVLALLLTGMMTVLAQEQEQRFIIVEQMPEYPGGEEAMQRYLRDFKPPAVPDIKLLERQVFIQFVIDTTGAVTDVVTKKSSGNTEVNEAAMRYINAMPRWTPGYQRHKPVAVVFTVPLKVH